MHNIIGKDSGDESKTGTSRTKLSKNLMVAGGPRCVLKQAGLSDHLIEDGSGSAIDQIGRRVELPHLPAIEHNDSIQCEVIEQEAEGSENQRK